MADLGEYQPSLPPQFGRWTSPWYIGLVEGEDDAWVHWLRAYQEESHCDTPGCCESPGIHLGPPLDPEHSVLSGRPADRCTEQHEVPTEANPTPAPCPHPSHIDREVGR